MTLGCYLEKLFAQTYIDEKGYRRFADTGRLVHRWAAAKKLGRTLRKEEVVHHKDRMKQNNKPDNLWVCKDQEAHDRIHKLDAQKFGKAASYRGFKR
jgi:hypothetical protein